MTSRPGSTLDRWEKRISSLRRIAFDSNALIYLLDSKEPYAPFVARAVSMIENGQATGLISTIVEMELLVKPMRERDTLTRDRIEVFLRETNNLAVRPVDRFVARRAADVRARTRVGPLGAVIVATALEEKCDAIVGNDYMVADRTTDINYLCVGDYI